ncbi:hypothetical protein CTI12_AA283550 [Artemisia annua]|uniref:Uncharacterized protein n=1 Tax=Artemisia annua TaxID=35608 RepID=A0A2U1NCP2_ARTAN|nr:hypothetical protein CTI12_AA283550 [Artemisia annua]
MVLTFVGRSNVDPCSNGSGDHVPELLDIIHNQGSFSLDILETFEINLDPYETDYENVKVSDEPNHGKGAAKMIRAIAEPLLVAHFGNSLMDSAFKELQKHVDEQMAIEKTLRTLFISISLTKI